MYYIQRYKLKNKADLQESQEVSSIYRFLDKDYMGSAEFEFGTVKRAWSDLCDNFPKIHRLTLDFKFNQDNTGIEVPVYVMAQEDILDNIKVELNKHLDGGRVGKLTEEFSGIWDTYSGIYRKELGAQHWLTVDLWQDVSYFVQQGRKKGLGSVFSAKLETIIKVYMELLRGKLFLDKEPDLYIGDMVYVQEGIKVVEAKVVGIHADYTVTLSREERRVTTSVFDILPIRDMEDKTFVEMIGSLDKHSVPL